MQTSTGPASFSEPPVPLRLEPYDLSPADKPKGLWLLHILALVVICGLPFSMIFFGGEEGLVEADELQSVSFASWAWGLILCFYVGGSVFAGWAALLWKRQLRPEDSEKNLLVEWAPHFPTVALLSITLAAGSFAVQFMGEVFLDEALTSILYQLVSSTAWLIVLLASMISACEDLSGPALLKTLWSRLRASPWALPRLVVALVARILGLTGVVMVGALWGPWQIAGVAVLMTPVVLVVGYRWLHQRLFLLYVDMHDLATEEFD